MNNKIILEINDETLLQEEIKGIEESILKPFGNRDDFFVELRIFTKKISHIHFSPSLWHLIQSCQCNSPHCPVTIFNENLIENLKKLAEND